MNLFWELFFSPDVAICKGAFVGTALHYLSGDKKRKWSLVSTLLTNYLAAIYTTGLLLEQTGSSQAMGISFLIGFFGFTIVEKTTDKLLEKLGTTNPSDTHGNPADPSL
jgi:hypothetical protein